MDAVAVKAERGDTAPLLCFAGDTGEIRAHNHRDRASHIGDEIGMQNLCSFESFIDQHIVVSHDSIYFGKPARKYTPGAGVPARFVKGDVVNRAAGGIMNQDQAV